MFEHFDHTADLGLRVRTDDLDQLFADAGRGLFAMIAANLEDVRPERQVEIRLEGDAPDYLLFDWLNELLYIFESQRLLLCEFDVRVSSTGLEAVVRGEPLDAGRHRLEHEVKAITYHGLRVEREDGGWLAEVVVDI